MNVKLSSSSPALNQGTSGPDSVPEARTSAPRQPQPLPDAGRALPGFPNGWFVVAYSHELRPGRLLSRRFMGRELVLFRTQSGAACAMDAYCPHLGAHFASGGKVEGEVIRCPFHGFCFDQQGVCVATGYNTKPPPTAKVYTWPLCEINGVILVYYDAEGRVPTWEVPAFSREGWTPLIGGLWRLRTHPQETSENSVDIGHLTWTHGFLSVEMLSDLEIDGPHLQAHYDVQRQAGIFGKSKRGMKMRLHVQVYGLGYSQVEVSLPAYGIQLRYLVCSTPTDEGWIELRGAVSMQRITRPHQIHPLLVLIPRALINKLTARLGYTGFVNDLQQDFKIWEQKRYVHPPALAAGDGPIGKYRAWARQFYPIQAQTPAAS